MKRMKVAAFMFALLASASASGQSREQARDKVVDKMVAVVNRELITYSDLIWQLALQPDTPLDNPRSDDLRRSLETLIDQRLAFAEAHKLPHIEPEAEEVERALADLVRRFPSQAELQQRVRKVGLTAERLREIVAERVEIGKYFDFRFRSFTITTTKEIEDYYRDVWVPRFRERSPGRIVPQFGDVRAEIERTLDEGKIESDISKFLDDTRANAEINILSPP